MEILIIDKDDSIFKSIRYRYDEDLVYAPDGESGLRMALEKPFDLILVNWTLPNTNGLSVLATLRGQGIGTPVLMIAEEDSVQEIVMALDAGANDCLIKPIETQVLIARMNALIRRSKWDASLPAQ